MQYAFEYVDPVAVWGGAEPPKPKSFRLEWRLSTTSIQSELGGRRRTDWSVVKLFCEQLCKQFAGELALVICDGLSGHSDLGDLSFDGKEWSPLDYMQWPWVPDKGGSKAVPADTGLSTPTSVLVVPTLQLMPDQESRFLG